MLWWKQYNIARKKRIVNRPKVKQPKDKNKRLF